MTVTPTATVYNFCEYRLFVLNFMYIEAIFDHRYLAKDPMIAVMSDLLWRTKRPPQYITFSGGSTATDQITATIVQNSCSVCLQKRLEQLTEAYLWCPRISLGYKTVGLSLLLWDILEFRYPVSRWLELLLKTRSKRCHHSISWSLRKQKIFNKKEDLFTKRDFWKTKVAFV